VGRFVVGRFVVGRFVVGRLLVGDRQLGLSIRAQRLGIAADT
jgi:hypothetical protein